MPVPNTGGVLRTTLASMQVGDYVKVSINGSSMGLSNYINEVGTSTKAEIPLTGGSDNTTATGSAYLIKVDKGLLICDRIVRNSISWDILNSSDLIQGMAFTLDGKTGTLRSLGGGNSYASATGTSQTTDASLGAWPIDNEWDTYIVKKDYGTGAGRDDVWHWSGVRTWTQETVISSVVAGGITGDSSGRTSRGNESSNKLMRSGSAAANTSTGFRPVFEWNEV